MGVSFPVELLDQDLIWIDAKGAEHQISHMDREQCLVSIDYILANSRTLRMAWSMKKETSFDETIRSRLWMLDRPVVGALMRQIVYIEFLEEEAMDASAG